MWMNVCHFPSWAPLQLVLSRRGNLRTRERVRTKYSIYLWLFVGVKPPEIPPNEEWKYNNNMLGYGCDSGMDGEGLKDEEIRRGVGPGAHAIQEVK